MAQLTHRDHLLHMLPAEAVFLILEELGFRDLMALRLTSKVLGGWLDHATRLVRRPRQAKK